MGAKLGCCSWIFGDMKLSEIAPLVKAAGLDGIELFADVVHVNPEDAVAICAENDLQIFSLTPADADISHPNEDLRQQGLSYYRDMIAFADRIAQAQGQAPLVSCHGLVSRIRPVTSQGQEDQLLALSVSEICDWAAAKNLTVVFEILNRYETHQIRTVAEGLAFIQKLNKPNLKLLPDAYHMNIEEEKPAEALRAAGKNLGLYHAADSNRCGVGHGHTDFSAQMSALAEIDYQGPIILEVNAPGPDPFSPDKGTGFCQVVQQELSFSRQRLQALQQAA